MDFYAGELQWVSERLALLPQAGATAGPTGRPPNSWAALGRSGALLVDAPFRHVFAGVERLVEEGRPPRALLLTHSDLLGQADALEEIADRFSMPVLLHPADAEGAPALVRDAVGDPALGELGFEAIHIPGHTPGSVMAAGDGLLLAGDSAVGPGPRQDADAPALERPKMSAEAEGPFLDRWRALAAGRRFEIVAPLHGRPVVGAEAVAAALPNLWEGSPMDPSG